MVVMKMMTAVASSNLTTDLFFFVMEIYSYCKNLGIPPDIIPSWIKDLQDCYNLDNTNQQSRSLTLDGYNDDDENDHAPLTLMEKENVVQEKNRPDSIDMIKTDSYNKVASSDYFEIDESASSSPINDVETPFISRISDFIAKKKKECLELYRYKLSLTDEVKGLESQKNNAQHNLNKITEREQHAMHFIEWFYKLKENLWIKYSIRIEGIDSFAKVINDFKNHRYDAYEIIKEYTEVRSVREEVIMKGARVNNLQREEQNLNENIEALRTLLDSQTQIMNTYSELTRMNLGLKELKLLMSTITGIAQANNVPHDKAVGKFFKDIEEQYDKKLGFENKISEKEVELENIKNNLSTSQFKLLLLPYVGPNLYYLLQRNVTYEDIVNMTLIASEYSKSISLSNDYKHNIKPESGIQQNTEKSEFWKILTEELKKFGDITLATREKSKKLEEIYKEICELKIQKQELTNYCENANAILNNLNSKISYLNGYINYLGNGVSNKIKAFQRLPPLFVFFINSNTEKKGEGGE